MTYLAYLDEFGHVGPRVARTDPKFRESPVFGLAGFILPAEKVCGFGTWFYQRKCELLAFGIARSGKHPALWEKKGASLCTVTNVSRYPELRRFTNRLLNRIEALGGFVLHVGVRKAAAPDRHDPNRLYARVLLEAIKRVVQFCAGDCDPPEEFVLILDEHNQPSTAGHAEHATDATNGDGISSSRRSMSRATAARPFRPPTGLRGWWDAWARSGPSLRFGRRTSSSAGMSSSASTASATAAVSGA